MRDFYLCYPTILTNTLVPQLGLSSILQNQLGVALDALTVGMYSEYSHTCLWKRTCMTSFVLPSRGSGVLMETKGY